MPTEPGWDLVVIGAGAAGLMCASIAGQLGLRVLLVDHAPRVAEKIRISGGGRCNFTNRDTGPGHFFSANPDFCRSALARYTPQDFIALVQRHRIGFHEKHKGQLFCDDSSEAIIAMLMQECRAGGVTRWQPCAVGEVGREGDGFRLDTQAGPVLTPRLVVATGGLSIPKIGATDFGHRLGRQFGHRVIEPRPALVPLTFAAEAWAPFASLAGLSLPVRVRSGGGKLRGDFVEDLLFTHRGLSGPAILQASTCWQAGQPLQIDLAPQLDLQAHLLAAKRNSRRQLGNELADCLPRRLAEAWLATVHQAGGPGPQQSMAECKDRALTTLAASMKDWQPLPTGTEGYRKAEVTAGGVDTRELQSNSLESRRMPGLYFIGEVVDVTGWLGGYNFQWAWASAAACARAIAHG